VPRDKLSHAQRRNAIRPVRERVDPFFPGYAFFSFAEDDEHWREVFKMVGVRGLVCANNRPVDVPWDMIREIQAREVNGAVPSETKLSEFSLLVGDRVRVTSGPFASFGGTIMELPKRLEGVDLSTITLDELDESYRVHLLIDIFGRQTPVELPLSEIEKI
jgi:transcription antitermination factor NusG